MTQILSKKNAKKGFMAYLSNDQYERLKNYSSNSQIPMSQLIREGIEARITKGNHYVAGYNKSIDNAIDALNKNTAAQMRFPSGASFAEILSAELLQLKLEEANEEGKIST